MDGCVIHLMYSLCCSKTIAPPMLSVLWFQYGTAWMNFTVLLIYASDEREQFSDQRVFKSAPCVLNIAWDCYYLCLWLRQIKITEKKWRKTKYRKCTICIIHSYRLPLFVDSFPALYEYNRFLDGKKQVCGFPTLTVYV